MTKPKMSREDQAIKIRRGIRAAQLRVALDTERGRETPAAVIRLSNMKLPEITTSTSKGTTGVVRGSSSVVEGTASKTHRHWVT